MTRTDETRRQIPPTPVSPDVPVSGHGFPGHTTAGTGRLPRPLRCLCVLLAVLALAAGSLGCGAATEKEEATKQADYHYQMAVSQFGEGHVPQAIRELTIALDQRPDHAEALHLMGFIYMGRKQYPEAIRYFRAALESKPDYLICKNNLGVAYLYMERWHEAAELYEGLRKETLYTSPWLAYANLGWAYYQMGRVQDAIEQTEMALFLNPDMCLAQNNLGIMKAERMAFDDAVASFEAAIEQCPGYAEPHLHLGQMWADAGNASKASTHFRKCLQLSTRNELGQRCKANARLYR